MSIALFEDMNGWQIAVTLADGFFFFLFCVAVCYLFLFSFSSMFNRRRKYRAAKKMYRYAVLFPFFGEDSMMAETVASFLRQDYPADRYDIVVICGSGQRASAGALAGLPVTVLQFDKPAYKKIEAIRFAMASLPEKAYDAAVVMDAGNTTETSFLRRINDAYASGGTAIQTHRIARHITTDTALFGAVSQEINNAIFRRGHVNLGFSSALTGSGMVFGFNWLQKNIAGAGGINLEKQLETMLLEQSVFIDYLDDVFVYEEKVDKPEEFYRERGMWLAARMDSIRYSIRKLPAALFSGNFDYCDKLFQWLLPSRTIILGVLSIITVALVFLSWPMSLKWWGLWLALVVAFSMAMPDYLIDARFIKAVKTMPLLFLLTLFNIFRKKVSKRA